MDDKEYYSLMNRTSRFVINSALKKVQEKKGKADAKGGGKSAGAQVNAQESQSYNSLELIQGKADAEMLMEKRQD